MKGKIMFFPFVGVYVKDLNQLLLLLTKTYKDTIRWINLSDFLVLLIFFIETMFIFNYISEKMHEALIMLLAPSTFFAILVALRKKQIYMMHSSVYIKYIEYHKN